MDSKRGFRFSERLELEASSRVGVRLFLLGLWLIALTTTYALNSSLSLFFSFTY